MSAEDQTTESIVSEDPGESAVSHVNEVPEIPKSGHMTLEEWTSKGNNADDWLSEKQFNRIGELFGVNRALKDELREVKVMVRAQEERARKSEELGYEKAIEDLRRLRNDAVLSGDDTRAGQYDNKIDELRIDQMKLKAANPSNGANIVNASFEGAQWIENNKKDWLNNNTTENIAITNFATTRDFQLQAQYPYLRDIERYKIVENELKTAFPTRFTSTKDGKTQETRSQKVSMVESPGQGSFSGKKPKVSYDDLPHDLKRVIDRFEPSLVKHYKSREEYRQSYIDDLLKAGQIKVE